MSACIPLLLLKWCPNPPPLIETKSGNLPDLLRAALQNARAAQCLHQKKLRCGDTCLFSAVCRAILYSQSGYKLCKRRVVSGVGKGKYGQDCSAFKRGHA